MRFLLISDTHIGGNGEGFVQQEALRDFMELVPAFKRLIEQEKIDFICHAGDLIHNGMAEQMLRAAWIFDDLSCPVYAVAGNHDLMQHESAGLLPMMMPNQFPEGKLDYTLIRQGIRFDFISCHWSADTPYYWDGGGSSQIAVLREDQWDLLQKDDQNYAARIVIMHSPVSPMSVEQSGLDRPIHPAGELFEQQWIECAKRLDIRLILGGHNHFNMLAWHNKTACVTVSSLRETPFECKLFEYTPESGTLSMKTLSLMPYMEKKFYAYNFDKAYVQGRVCDRSFVMEDFAVKQ